MPSVQPGAGAHYPAWLERGAGWASRLLLIVGAAGVLLWLVLQVQYIATGVVLGFAVTALLWPVARGMRRVGFPAALAAILCLLGFLGVFGMILWFVIAQVINSMPVLAASLGDAVQSLLRSLSETPVATRSAEFQEVINQVQAFVGRLVSNIGSGVLTGLVAAANLATVLAVATFFALFALAGGDKLWRQFVALLPAGERAPADAAFRAAMRTTGNWFYASTLTGFINGALIGIGLAVLRVPMAVPIGALTFLFAYVPLVGATLAGVIAVAMAFASGGLVTALWALGVVLFVQQVEGNLLAPLLLSRAVNFPPLLVLVLTTTAAAAFGLVGLFLAVPVTGAAVAAVLTYRRTAAGLAPTPSPDPTKAPAEEPTPLAEQVEEGVTGRPAPEPGWRQRLVNGNAGPVAALARLRRRIERRRRVG